jgi:hypothetical protein
VQIFNDLGLVRTPASMARILDGFLIAEIVILMLKTISAGPHADAVVDVVKKVYSPVTKRRRLRAARGAAWLV